MNIYPKYTIPDIITIGKKYFVKGKVFLNIYLIMSDNGTERALPGVLFITEQEYRNEMIDNILE